MNPRIISLDASTFSPVRHSPLKEPEGGPRRTFLLSPYDTPERVTIEEDDGCYHLIIHYMSPPSEAPQKEKLQGSGDTLLIDPPTGRVVGLEVSKAGEPKRKLPEALRRLAVQVVVPDSDFIHGGEERGRQFRRAVLPIVLNATAERLGFRGGE